MNILDQDVLILNKNWQWIAMTTVKDSMTKIMGYDKNGYRAVVVDGDYQTHDYESWIKQPVNLDRAIKTPRKLIPAPEIILMLRYNEVPHHSIRWARIRLLKRDKFTCQYCGAQPGVASLTVDHVLPSSRGGRTSWENTVACCEPCNAKKADRLPSEVGMKLKRMPAVPFASLVKDVETREDVLESWKPFIRTGK